MKKAAKGGFFTSAPYFASLSGASPAPTTAVMPVYRWR